ncbi:hypothetical protein M6I34_15160 [Burkholderiaceae bacterium FT117]|uniref:ubiquinone biosynthesis accessory factor UbiJ n=1 Tax=Zeimonas sediminis TaxID=2944268 RepID=UPI002342C838|nr:SCP2 sterol-binding domain-containing protein [Zeimonas sediminis]MCM5571857.1 hypothetical protein [Zeimonas sediminis]
MEIPSGGSAGLPGRLARQGAAALVAALDHLLEQNEWARARLAMHAGRRVLIGVDLPALPGLPEPRILAAIADGGRLQPASGEGSEPAVTMMLRPSVDAAFDFARGGPRELSRHLRIEGDVMLAAALGELAQHLRWDAAEDLSRVTGDVAAQRIVGAAEGAFGALRDAGDRLQSNLLRYLSVESGQLVDRSALDAFASQLDGLERRLQALSSRGRSPR